TRSLSSGGAARRAARSSRRIASGCDIARHLLLQLLQGAAQPRRARRRADPEDARRRLAVQVEQHAQCDHLALAGGEAAERPLQLRREAAVDPVLRLERLAQRVDALASAPPPLRPEVVERGRARELAEPGADAAAAGVEPVPEAERPLERLGRQVL